MEVWTGAGILRHFLGCSRRHPGEGYKSHTGEALRIDRPIAGLNRDLKQRNLLDSTVVMITTEFGGTPYAQAGSGKLNKGRDHHPEGFTNVLVGGGLKLIFAFGATDPIGYSAIENPVTTYDMHATILHLLGIDHERLTFYHNGIQRHSTAFNECSRACGERALCANASVKGMVPHFTVVFGRHERSRPKHVT